MRRLLLSAEEYGIPWIPICNSARSVCINDDAPNVDNKHRDSQSRTEKD